MERGRSTGVLGAIEPCGVAGQLAACGGAETATGGLLQFMGNAANQQITAELWWW